MRARIVGARAALANRPGVRSSLTVLIASFAGHAGNYLYYVVAGRMVGVAQFAEISSMIALATIVFMPFNGLQVAAARDVARLVAVDDVAGVSGYLRSLLRRTGAGVGAVIVALVVASPLVARWLSLDSSWFVVLAAAWTGLGSVLIAATGVVQGQQRFGLVAVILAGPLGLFRVLLLPGLLVIAGLAGSMLAMLLATVVGLVLVVRPLADGLRAAPDHAVVFRPGRAVVALLAFSSLTNIDLLVAKATLDPVRAGQYAGAVLLGKIALFAPGALALVLLPRAAARLERGEDADRTVLATIAVTAASGLAITLLLVLPINPMVLTFGDQFAGATGLLGPLALVMTAAAVMNVHLTFAMARDSRWFPPLLVVAALTHAGLLALLHGSPGQIVVASATAIGGALLVHEVASPHGALRMLRRARHSTSWTRSG